MTTPLRPSTLRASLALARRTLHQHLATLALARRTLHQHLATNTPATHAQTQPLSLVVGNESADLDSITSALIYAYFGNYGYPDKPNPTRLHIPVLNIPRSDIRIRPELLKLLPYGGIEESDLITVDDVLPSGESAEQLTPATTSVTLVDHNAPTGPFAGFKDAIVGCIDHHVDEGIVPFTVNPRIITRDAGSCTSLVVAHVRPTWDHLSTSASSSGAANAQDEDEAVRRKWDAQLAKLALASVLIDTNELKDESKTRDVDRWAVGYLLAKIDLAGMGGGCGVFEQGKFFREIEGAKGNLEGLRVEEVLRKDYKEWVVNEKKLGISSVVKRLDWIEEKARDEREGDLSGLVVEAGEFARKRGLNVFAIMTATVHGPEKKFGRELMLWTEKGEWFAAGWEKRLTTELELEPVGDMVRPQVWVWRQNELSKSRKQVAPLVRELMEEAD